LNLNQQSSMQTTPDNASHRFTPFHNEEDDIRTAYTSNLHPQQKLVSIDKEEKSHQHDASINLHKELSSPLAPSENQTYPFKEALKILILNSLPLIMIYFILFSIRNLSLHLIKEKNDERLSTAVGLANTILNVVGLSIFISLNTGLTSCSAQAFGAKNYQLVGFYLHRGFIINLICLIPGFSVLYFCDKIAFLLGFDEQTSLYTQQITSYCIPGIFFLMIYHTLSAYLNGCDIFVAPAIALVVSAIMFWTSSYYLFVVAKLDILGIALSFNTMQFVAAALLFFYIKYSNPVPGSFFWLKRQSFQDLWQLFKYEFFVGSMIFLKAISSEIIYLFAGNLTLVEVSSLTIVYTNLQSWSAMPISIADIVLTFMGNAMGEGNIQKAKQFLKAGAISSVVVAVFVQLYYLAYARQTASFYINNEEIVSECVKIFGVYLLYYPADFLQQILSSGLRAIGLEKYGSVMFVVVFYVIAIPLSYFICFIMGIGVMGLVIGPMVSSCILCIWLLVAFARIDWKAQIRDIQNRLRKDDIALGKLSSIANLEMHQKQHEKA